MPDRHQATHVQRDEAATLAQLAAMVMTAVEARLTEERLRREIAVHEQTSRTLRTVEMRYQRIAEHTPGMVYQFVRRSDGRGEFTFVSDACRRLLGLDPSALQQDAGRYFELVHPEDRAIVFG